MCFFSTQKLNYHFGHKYRSWHAPVVAIMVLQLLQVLVMQYGLYLWQKLQLQFWVLKNCILAIAVQHSKRQCPIKSEPYIVEEKPLYLTHHFDTWGTRLDHLRIDTTNRSGINGQCKSLALSALSSQNSGKCRTFCGAESAKSAFDHPP